MSSQKMCVQLSWMCSGHRIGITSYEAEAENITSEDIIYKIVNVIEVP